MTRTTIKVASTIKPARRERELALHDRQVEAEM
jgi:hypothetical protein